MRDEFPVVDAELVLKIIENAYDFTDDFKLLVKKNSRNCIAIKK
jgi:hypothetical protein